MNFFIFIYLVFFTCYLIRLEPNLLGRSIMFIFLHQLFILITYLSIHATNKYGYLNYNQLIETPVFFVFLFLQCGQIISRIFLLYYVSIIHQEKVGLSTSYIGVKCFTNWLQTRQSNILIAMPFNIICLNLNFYIF